MPNEIFLEVATPNGVFNGGFPPTTKIEDVISTIVNSQQLIEGDSFELVHNGEVLQPEQRPLVSFGLSETTMLELVATGSGV